MRIAMLHPDLGIGGAERLVVDAAVGLVHNGHEVHMYTSHYNAARSFAETRQGDFPISVHGDWLPRHLAGGLHIIFALLRNIWLAFAVAFTSIHYDVFLCDQVSICVPILKLLRPKARILFYCHFPDSLLSARGSWLKALYRAPFDWIEEASTAAADGILVNSNFTKGVVAETFTSLQPRMSEVQVLYPCIDVAAFPDKVAPPPTDPIVFVSINRFERKKDIGLAVRALAQLHSQLPDARPTLLLAGGWDPRVHENVEHYNELHALCKELGLRTLPPRAGDSMPASDVISGVARQGKADVGFVRSFSDEDKTELLRLAAAVVYTPQREHFGIVPIEAMAAHRPVIACASGGPLESIKHGDTGFLQAPEAAAFAESMCAVARDPAAALAMGAAGRKRAVDTFSRAAFGERLSDVCEHLVRHGNLQGL